jgi:competence protein ComEA
MTLPGIGVVRSAAIVEHRENYGDFVNIEDIMNVKGIKNGIFSKINNLICVK